MEHITTSSLNLEQAGKILKVGSDFSGKNFLNNYIVNLEVAQDNNEFHIAPISYWAAAWRVGNQHHVVKEISTNGKFVPNIRFEKAKGLNLQTCDACKGAGERFKFQKKPIQVGCLKCKDVLIHLNGKDLIIEGDIITYDGKNVSDDPKYKRFLGKVVENCISCGGSGRYITEDKEYGGSNNLLCKTCHGINIDGLSKTTQIIKKCKTCRGKRKIKIPVISPEIKSTTICHKCSGRGFIVHNPMNPVISQDIADGIKTL